jgi:AmmeMemoRadiSam system protein A
VRLLLAGLRVDNVSLSADQAAWLVAIARKAIDSVVIDEQTPTSAEAIANMMNLPQETRELLGVERGAFVTLRTSDGRLRGCIGIPYPVEPLGEALVRAATGAAAHDPRFPRVVPSELDSLTVEVSALTKPEILACPAAERPVWVRVGTDGLIASGHGRSGLLLPQVATEMGLTAEVFLSLTCQKAGLSSDAWRSSSVEISRFQAEVFGERTPRGAIVEERLAQPSQG